MFMGWFVSADLHWSTSLHPRRSSGPFLSASSNNRSLCGRHPRIGRPVTHRGPESGDDVRGMLDVSEIANGGEKQQVMVVADEAESNGHELRGLALAVCAYPLPARRGNRSVDDMLRNVRRARRNRQKWIIVAATSADRLRTKGRSTMD